MRTFIHRGRPLLALLGLVLPVAAAETSAQPPFNPDRTELWVPSADLEKVLEKNKNAFLLTPQQYEALIRDAGKVKPNPDSAPPPVSAIVEGIQLSGKVVDGESAILIRGQMQARALASGWSHATVVLPWSSIGKLSTRGDALLENQMPQPTKGGAIAETDSLMLWMKGPAEHQIDFECAARILQGSSPDERVLVFRSSKVPAVFDLELPTGSQITQGPAREMRGTVHRFFLQGAVGVGSTIAWRLPPPVGSKARVSSQSLRGVCRFSASELISTYDVQVSSTATDSPTRQIVFDVSPRETTITSVEGEGVASWLHVDGALSVTLSTESRAAALRVEMRMPVVLPGSVPLPVVLPSLVLLGAKQVPAISEVVLDEGVELLELQASRQISANLAEWDAVAGPATALIRHVSPRIGVDADTRVFVSRDFIEIERTLNAASDVGVDHLKVDLPADEELLEVTWISGPKLEWKRVGQSVDIDWISAIQGKSQGKWSMKSRNKLDPAAARQSVAVTNVAIAAAKKVAGYVALDHESGWSISLNENSGLEDRDVRLTPVKGRMAWFNMREFRLGFDVQKKESVVDAEITAYALPRARTIEMVGQIVLDISGAPLRQIEVRITPALSKLVRFTSPLISEQVLNETTGSWNLTLARESTGRVTLPFRLSLPGREEGDASVSARTLVATFPRLELPLARRFRGSWVVEANTDTQLSFATQSLQPVDVMRVPAVQDYTPRHRLVAAFAYGSGEHELTVTAARHASSPLAALVVSQLRLTSVLSEDGNSRHEALLSLSHSGEQFAHVRLPSGAQLLSAIVNGSAVKPVRGENGTIALPLPGGAANTDTVTARVLYELTGEPWHGTGKRKLEPITLLGEAPILSTHWTVHAPEGFSYDKVDTGLEQRGTFEPEGLGIAFGKTVDDVFGTTNEPEVVGYLPVEGLEHGRQTRTRSSIQSSAATSSLPEAPPDILDSSRRRESMRGDVSGRWDNQIPIADAADPFGAGTQPSAYLKDKISGIILPEVSLSGATLEEAIEYLRAKSREFDTKEKIEEKKGLNIILAAGATPMTARITLDLKNVPMDEALRYVTELAGMRLKEEPYAVLIVPLTETSSDFFTRVYRVPPDFLGLDPGKSAMELLKETGVQFSENASAVFNTETSQLIVKNTQPNLDLIESFVQSITDRYVNEGVIPGMFILSDTRDLPDDPAKVRVMGKLESIILPTVSLKDTKVRDAIQYLNEAGAKADRQESDPAKKGVLVQYNEQQIPVDQAMTLELKDVPLLEALRYVTELASLKFKIEDGRVVVVPLFESAAEVYTVNYAVPKKLIASFAGKSVSSELKSELGVAAEVSLMDGVGRLTVTSSKPNLELVEAWLTTQWEASKETPPISRDRARKRIRSDPFGAAAPASHSLLPPVDDPFGEATSKSGIIPLELELPTAGQVLTFEGAQAPEVLDLSYISWRRQMARACLLMALGGLLFALCGRHRAFLRTVLVVLLLSLGVKLVAETQLPLANAILFGWLVGWTIWMIFRLFSRLEAPRASRAVVAVVLSLSCLIFQSSSLAQEMKLPPDPAAHTVIVPYDVKRQISGQKPQRYYLDRDSFEKLWSLAKENRRPEPPSGSDAKDAATIHSAAYRATVEEERLVIEARLEIGTRGAWTLTALPFKSDDSTLAVVRDWMMDGKPAVVVNGNIQIENPGVHVVQAVIELNRKAGWKEAALKLPPASAAFVEISTPLTDGRPELEGVDLLTEEQQGDRRLFTAVLRRPSIWKLKRSPRRPLADVDVPAVAESELIIGHSSGGAQSLLATVQFGFPGTERKNFSLTVDLDWQIAGWTVRQQSGEVAVRHWSAWEEAGRRVLNFELDRPVADEAAVSLWGVRSAGLGTLNTPVLEPAVLKGQQLVILLHDETLKLEPKPKGDQRRVDKPTGVIPVLGGGRGKTTELFYRLPLKQTLAYEIKAAASGLESVTDYVFQLSEQKQEMMAAVTLRRSRDAWAQLRLGLPQGFEIQSVDGPGLSSWKQEEEEVYLQFQPNGSTSETRLILYLARSVPESQSTWKLQTLRFTDFEKQTGSAVIVAHAATEARLSDFSGSPDLREVDPADVSGVFVITPPLERKRALRFERGDWTADVALAKQPVRFSSDGIVLAQATDAGMLVSQQVAFFVEQGALGRVTVRLPASLPEATVKGEALREVQTRLNGAVREYDCSFQSDVLSHAALTFDMELPLVESLTLPMVKVDAAERLRRFFVLDNSSSREARVVKAEGVESCAKGALPYVPDVLTQPSFYRSKGDNGDLQIAYQQLQSTEGNSAIVTLADITSAWRSDGERWDTVVYSVYNRSLQFLPVILPADAELVGVSVSGEAVRADEETRPDGSKVRLIPLIQTRAGQRSLEVRLIYRIRAGEVSRLKSLKSLRMDDPELLGISAERTLWTAIVPKRLMVDEVDGNMEEVAEESKVVERLQGLMSDFSRMNKALSSRGNVSKAEGDYTLMEAEKLAQQIEVESSKVEQLSRSKSSYWRSKPKADDDGKDLKLQGKVLNDITDLNESLVKQKVVLTENRVQAPVFNNAKDSSLSISNTWSANNVPTAGGRSEFDGFINYGTPLAVPATDAMGNSQSTVLNDNTLVQNDFLKSPQAVRKSETMGNIAATAGVTFLKSGAGTLDLSGANTYTGATTLGGGTVVLGTGSVVINGGTQIHFGDTSATLPGQGNVMPKEQAAQVFNAGNNGRANMASQNQKPGGVPDVVDMPDAEKMIGGAVVQSPSPSNRTADAVMSPADPFAAVPAAPAAARSAGVVGATKVKQADKDGGGFDAPEIPKAFGLEAQVSSQLRATGRRSLLVEVPSDGQVYHFRKLKDHAVLELHLRKVWTAEQKSTAIWLGVGLAVWGLLTRVTNRRRTTS